MEVVNSVQKAILLSFGKVAESDEFYLTGGTALAYFYLRHRKSNDLDFFTANEEMIGPFSRRLEQTLAAEGMSITRQRGLHSFVELLVRRGQEETVIHLAQDAAFRFAPTEEFPEFPKLRVDNLTDVASNKLLALFGRATLRDFIDVYCLIQKGHFKPEDLIEKAKRKDPGFDLYWLGVAFERIRTFDENTPEMVMLLEPIVFKELQSFFDRWRQEITQGL